MSVTKRLKNKEEHRIQYMCTEYAVEGEGDFDDFLASAQQISSDHTDHHVLLTLDDPGQAEYTSAHAVESHDLQQFDERFRGKMSAELFKDGDYSGWGGTEAEFPLRLHNFRKHISGSSFSDAIERGLTFTEDNAAEWQALQKSPATAFEAPVSAIAVPVDIQEEALAAFPNGYFTCDLSPAENASVIQKFAELNYQLFGIGASYLGIVRAELADDSLAKTAADILCSLYNVDGDNLSMMHAVFAQGISGRRHLFLRYTDN